MSIFKKQTSNIKNWREWGLSSKLEKSKTKNE